jgi:hypothetical protein
VAAQKTLNARRWTDVGFGMLHLSNKQRYERVGSRLSLDTDSSDSLQDFSANAQDQRRTAWQILQAKLATVRWILMLD